MNRFSRQRISKDTGELNNTFNQVDLTDIWRLLHPTTNSRIHIFSSLHGTLSTTDHILEHKTNLNKFKIVEIIQCPFSDYKGINIEVSNRRISGKSPNKWRLNNTLLNNAWVKEEISREIKNYFELNRNENTTYQMLWDTAIVVHRGKFIALNILGKKI